MTTVGVTGPIACGKTEVAREFARLGACLISADQIGREVVDSAPELLPRLVDAFGAQILTQAGNLNRRELGRLVFSSPDRLKVLNQIVHPPLLARLRQALVESAHDPRCRIVVVDAALLLDWRLDQELDFVVGVLSSPELQLSRLVAMGLTEAEARARIQAQRPAQSFREAADFVIANNDSVEKLRAMAREVFRSISSAGTPKA